MTVKDHGSGLLPASLVGDDDTPAAAVRRALEESRVRGVPFDVAWEAAVAELPRGRSQLTAARGEQHAAQWRAAITSAEASFRAAYERRPAPRGERALASMLAWWRAGD